MSIMALAQQSQPPPCDLKSVNWDNCQGSRRYPNGVYVGEFRDNKFDGPGTLTAPDGTKYVGEFKDNTFDGQGSLTSPDGRKYVGEFKDNKFQGTFTSPDGRKYVGEFKDNKFDGQGTFYAAGASIGLSGIWADGEFVSTSQELVAMEQEGGVYVVPVRFNEALTLNAVIDSGVADVSVPADIVSTLIRTKTVSEQDFLGVQTYVLADGTKVRDVPAIVEIGGAALLALSL
jgi:hypothetical protein